MTAHPTFTDSQPSQPVFVRVCKAPAMFGVSRATIYRAAERGDLQIHKRGAMSFIQTSEVIAWITGGKKELGG